MIKEIKEKLQSAYGWVKEKGKAFWKWIVGALIVTASAASLLPSTIILPEVYPTPIYVDGVERAFPNTDDIMGEDLIIFTDKGVYSGIDQSDVYIVVRSEATSTQNVSLFFFFEDTLKSAGEVLFIKSPAFSLPATTTKPITSVTQKLVSSDLTDDEYGSIVRSSGVDVKGKDGYVPMRRDTFVLKPGETKYFKTSIRFPVKVTGEFFIEVVGDKGGYGHLDPVYVSNTNCNSASSNYTPYNNAQTWTATDDLSLSKISMSIYRVGNPGTIIMELLSTSGGTPGSVLASGTYNGNLITTDTGGEYATVTMASAYTVASGTQYVASLVVGGDASNKIVNRMNTGNPYSGGTMWQGVPGSWTQYAGYDLCFEIYGEAITTTEEIQMEVQIVE